MTSRTNRMTNTPIATCRPIGRESPLKQSTPTTDNGKTWHHVRAILVLPVAVTIVIPAALLWAQGSDTLHLSDTSMSLRITCGIIGTLAFACGATLMFLTIRLFVTVGRGTLAPWNPTQNLVAKGIYQRVRNPMISGVFMVLSGEALIFASTPIAIWTASFIIINLIYIPLFEERGLAARFGAPYELYCRQVPRWIPRVRKSK